MVFRAVSFSPVIRQIFVTERTAAAPAPGGAWEVVSLPVAPLRYAGGISRVGELKAGEFCAFWNLDRNAPLECRLMIDTNLLKTQGDTKFWLSLSPE
jgi:hypothetical protein